MQIFSRLVYGALSTVVFPLAALFAVCNRKLRVDLRERLLCGGWSNLELNSCIWIHAASVGELQGVIPLVERIRSKITDPIIVTTTSLTGRTKARDIAGVQNALLIPYDHPILISLVIRKIKPRVFLLFETELWPNLILGLKKFRIPVVLINGRVSDKAFPKYLRFRSFIAPILRCISICLVQSQKDKVRFEILGASNAKVMGCSKYDALVPDLTEASTKLLEELECPVDSEILVCGSVRPGESNIILRVAKELVSKFENFRIIIAPRHPEQFELEGIKATEEGFRVSKRSDPRADAKVFILDSLGELQVAYAASTISFVGGTLINIGGHNPMEPAQFGKPILIGPYTQNVEEASSELINAGGAIRVVDQSEFKDEVERLLLDSEYRRRVGNYASKVLMAHRGAVDRVVTEITPLIENGTAKSICFDSAYVILKFLELIYLVGTSLRNYLYDCGILKSYKSSLPIVCLGNITVGGNAKSPVTQKVAELLIERGLKPVIMLRGYGGSELGPIEVKDASAVDRFGDEACMHKLALPSVPVVVSRSRVEGAEFIEWQRLGNIVLLDDGFQHRALKSDLSLLLFDSDSLRQVERGELLPLGRLRESPSGALRRADGVCLIERGDSIERPSWLAEENRLFKFSLSLTKITSAVASRAYTWSELDNRSVSLIASIAKPDTFKRMVSEKGLKVIQTIFRPDHAGWSREDLSTLEKLPGDFILTTTKDLAKLRNIPGIPDRLLVVGLAVNVPAGFDEWVRLKLNP